MNQLLQGKPLTVFGDGLQTRAFSYIGDVAPVIAKSVHHRAALNQVFNIGADTECTVRQLAETVMDAMELKSPLNHLPPRNEVVHAYANHDKAKEVFNITTTTTLREGLFRMAGWAKAAGSRKSKKFENIEIEKNLPAIWLED